MTRMRSRRVRYARVMPSGGGGGGRQGGRWCPLRAWYPLHVHELFMKFMKVHSRKYAVAGSSS